MGKKTKAHFRDNFTLTTWLFVGALMQGALFLVYPDRLVILPALLVISLRVFKNFLSGWGFIPDPSSKEVR